MSDMNFQMRLHCSYVDDDNAIGALTVEHRNNDDWQAIDLNFSTPGFDIFTYSILACQHMYFRINAAESGLILSSCDGLITMQTDEHRSIKALHVKFSGKLHHGEPSQKKTEYIIQRMDQCPVSINLKSIDDRKTSITFVTN